MDHSGSLGGRFRDDLFLAVIVATFLLSRLRNWKGNYLIRAMINLEAGEPEQERMEDVTYLSAAFSFWFCAFQIQFLLPV